MTPGIEYRMLGPLEVVRGGAVVAARGQKQRALLARLLLAAGRTVPVGARRSGSRRCSCARRRARSAGPPAVLAAVRRTDERRSPTVSCARGRRSCSARRSRAGAGRRGRESSGRPPRLRPLNRDDLRRLASRTRIDADPRSAASRAPLRVSGARRRSPAARRPAPPADARPLRARRHAEALAVFQTCAPRYATARHAETRRPRRASCTFGSRTRTPRSSWQPGPRARAGGSLPIASVPRALGARRAGRPRARQRRGDWGVAARRPVRPAATLR